MSAQRRITLVEEADGWLAIDEETGLECRGEERAAVLARLDDAAAVSFEEGQAADAAEPLDESADDQEEPALEWFEA